MPETVRVLHFSDIHLDVPTREIPLADLPGRRLLGLANHLVGRGRLFRNARRKVEALTHFAREQGAELVVCTGDHTILGTEPEMRLARSLLDPLTGVRHGLVTVPGNHDLYAPDGVHERRFERCFGDLLHSDLPDLCVDGPWPLVRLVGENLAVVALNSARPNPQPWRSSGRVSTEQLNALPAIFEDPRLRSRFVLLATHYALRRPDGSPDSWLHRLENADALERVCAAVNPGAFLHGHIHRCFRLALPHLSTPIFGAGSATQDGREGMWLFDLHAGGGTATRCEWSDDRYATRETNTL